MTRRMALADTDETITLQADGSEVILPVKKAVTAKPKRSTMDDANPYEKWYNAFQYTGLMMKAVNLAMIHKLHDEWKKAGLISKDLDIGPFVKDFTNGSYRNAIAVDRTMITMRDTGSYTAWIPVSGDLFKRLISIEPDPYGYDSDTGWRVTCLLNAAGNPFEKSSLGENMDPEKFVAWAEKFFGADGDLWNLGFWTKTADLTIDVNNLRAIDPSIERFFEGESKSTTEVLNEEIKKEISGRSKSDRTPVVDDPEGFVGYMIRNYLNKINFICAKLGDIEKDDSVRGIPYTSLAEWEVMSDADKIKYQIDNETAAKLKLFSRRMDRIFSYVKIEIDGETAVDITRFSPDPDSDEPEEEQRPHVLDILTYVTAGLAHMKTSKELKKPNKNMYALPIIRRNDDRDIREGNLPAPRYNEDRLAVNMDGSFYYLPDIDMVEELERIMIEEVCHQLPTPGRSGKPGSEDFTVGLKSPFRTDKEFELAGQNVPPIVWFDQKRHVLSYYTKSNRTGSPNIINFGKCRPLAAHHIDALLRFNFLKHTGDNPFLNMIKSFDNVVKKRAETVKSKIQVSMNDFLALVNPLTGDSIGTAFAGSNWLPSGAELNQLADEDANPTPTDDGAVLQGSRDKVMQLIKQEGMLGYAMAVVSWMAKIQDREKGWTDELRDAVGGDPDRSWILDYDAASITLRDVAVDSRIRMLRPLAAVVNAICEEIGGKPDEFLSEWDNIDNRMEYNLRTVAMAIVWHKYFRNPAVIADEVREYNESIDVDSVPVSQDWQAPAMPFAEDSFKLLGHQGLVLQKLARDPKYIMLQVSTGGGKTTIGLYHIVQLMQEKGIKRPLIMSPGNLFGNYREELVKYTGGAYNLIPLDRFSFDRYNGYEGLGARIENAPPNTIFITSYEWAKGNVEPYPYIDDTIEISNNCNFLKDYLQPDALVMDEAHQIKNETSTRTQFTRELTSAPSIRYIVMMSGTTVSKDIGDLVAQSSVLDPTIFGDLEDFKKEYGIVVGKGNNVARWKPGANEEVSRRLADNIALIKISQKYWGWMLPMLHVKAHTVKFTEKQRKWYEVIMRQIESEVIDSEEYKRAEATGAVDSIEGAMKVHLHKLEQYCTWPGDTEVMKKYGLNLLPEKEQVSPKNAKVIEIIQDHLRKDLPGKILVWTEYRQSGLGIYESLPPDLKQQTIYYTAEDQENAKQQFLNDSNKKVMVGCMRTLIMGHNLQNASRIIRVESMWTSGDLEQSEARIFRPDIENIYGITDKYLDFVIVERTVEILKTARLYSKWIESKQYNDDEGAFDDIDVPERITMSIKNIADPSKVTEEVFRPFEAAHNELRVKEQALFKEFAARPTTIREPFNVERAPDVPGARLMLEPFIPGAPLPLKGTPLEGKLLPMAIWTDLMFEDPTISMRNAPLEGETVLTEDGTGIVVNDYLDEEGNPTRKSGTVLIDFKAHGKKSVPRSRLFVFTRDIVRDMDETGAQFQVTREIANALQLPALTEQESVTYVDDEGETQTSQVGDLFETDSTGEVEPTMEDEYMLDDEGEVEEYEDREGFAADRNTDTVENRQFSVYVTSENFQVCLAVDTRDGDVANFLRDARAAGEVFEFTTPFMYAEITNVKGMRNLYDRVDAFLTQQGESVVFEDYMREMIEQMDYLWRDKRSKVGVLNQLDARAMKEFRLLRRNIASKTDHLLLFFCVSYDEKQQPRLFVRITENPVGKRFKSRNASIPGLSWKYSDGQWMAYFRTKKEAKAFLEEMQDVALDQGYIIGNIEEALDAVDGIRIQKGG